jgi:hypothetical protein
MVFVRRRKRIQRTIVEIGEASSGFSNSRRWRFAAVNGAGSSTVTATLLAYAASNADPKNMVGSVYRPLSIC